MAQDHSPTDLGFIFIGGMHQALHLAPVALALARRSGVTITAYAPPLDVAALRALFERIAPSAAGLLTIVPLILPFWAEVLQMVLGRHRGAKPLAIIAWRRRLLRHCALVTAERTSTLLKRWPGRKPVMLHIPHGAGDRAGGFDKRIRLFDHVLVNGEYVLDRTVAENLTTPEKLTAIGSLKLAALKKCAGTTPAMFTDDQPTILYNPHFDERLSSWRDATEIVDAIVQDGRFNLIVAPHARLASVMEAADFVKWEAIGQHPNVHFDVTSFRLSDMTYARAADIYLGDVSSQVYEFLSQPRPAVFFNAHNVDWLESPDYRMWRLGEVATTIPGVVSALAQAAERHPAFRARQQRFVSAMLGAIDDQVPERAASALLAALQRVRRPSTDDAYRNITQFRAAGG